jgi:hypothetical protein
MQLWSVQSSEFVEIATRTGVAYPSWDHVDELWKPAFCWMTRQLNIRGLGSPDGTPPVWAWHSCGCWQCPPERDDLDMLLGSEPQPHLRLVMVAMEVADDECVLSYYGPWCDMLTHSMVHDGQLIEPVDLWHDAGNSVPNPWRAKGNVPDIQACLPRLENRHIRQVEALH